MSILRRLARVWVLAAVTLATLVGLTVFWSQPEHRVAIRSVPGAHDLPRDTTSCPPASAAQASVPSVDAAGTDVGAPLLPSAAPSPAADDAGADDVPADGFDDGPDAGLDDGPYAVPSAAPSAASPASVESC